MYLAPQAAFKTAVLAGISLAFPFSLDTRAVDKQVQWSCRAIVGNGNGQGSLSPAQGAVIWDRPVQPNEFQKARYKPFGLSQGQPEQDLEGQTGPYRRIAISLLASASTGRCSLPHHLRVKPDRKRSSLLQ